MKLHKIRQQLISYGYHPDEVEYALIEVLQYKNAKLLNSMDIKILKSMLQERMEINRAKSYRKNLCC